MNLWTRDPAAAACAAQELCTAAARAATERADEICNHTFVFRDHWEMEQTNRPVHFDGAVDWQSAPAGDMEWVYALNRHTIFLNLAKAWRYTGDSKYLTSFVELAEDWLVHIPPTPKTEATAWRALEAGIRPEYWLRALELFGDAVPDALRGRMYKSLRQHGEYLARTHGAFHALSNWGAIQAHGLFLISVQLERRDWQNLALKRMAENLHNAVLPDGIHWEQSPMYHCEVLHAAADTLLIARRTGTSVPVELERLTHAMATALAYWAAPNRYILPQGDSDAIDAGDLLAQGALLFKDPMLAAAAQGAVCEETIWDFGSEALARLQSMIAARPACPSAAFAASGNPVLRTGWGETDTYLHVHTGSLGGGHGHADLLHLDVWHGGEAVLTDSGRYTYVNGAQRYQLKAPAAHNTLLLDGQDFTRYVDTWNWENPAPPLPQRTCFTPQADFVSGGHLGYLPQGVVVTRRLVLLRPDLVVGVDTVYTTDNTPHTAEQFFHFGRGALTAEGKTARWRGSKTTAELHWFAGESAACYAPLSPTYNVMTQAPALRLTTQITGTTALPFVLCLGGTCKAVLLPVSTAYGQELPPDTAQALRISREGADYTLIFVHKRDPHDGALLCAGGCSGRGNVLLFTPQSPDGLCLD